jgi:Aspartyl protease/PDZ domain
MPPASTPLTTIEFTRHGGLIYLPVSVAGNDPLSFILETGAQPSIVDSDIALALGLGHGATSTASGAGAGTAKLSVLENVSLQAGKVRVPKPLVIATPFEPLSKMTGHPTDGALGNDFIGRFVVSIDFASNQIDLYDPSFDPGEEFGEAIPVSVESGHALIDATLSLSDGRTIGGRFAVDTGARPSAVISSSFVDQHGLLDAVPQLYNVTGRGLVGTSEVPLGRVQSIGIGPFKIDEPVCGFSRDRSGAFATQPWAGVIGNAIWQRFRMTIDYRRKRILLAPNESFTEREQYDCSGLSLVAEGDDLTTIRVQSVSPDSPADRAGIKAGDRLTGVTQLFGLEKLTDLTTARSALQQPGQVRQLWVSRRGAEMSFMVMTRELI